MRKLSYDEVTDDLYEYESNYDKVVQFHKAFNLPYPDKYTLPDEKTLLLRGELILEELDELSVEVGKAFENGEVSPEFVAKELADLLYVVYGLGVTLGIDVDAVFAEVHRSNMSKLDENGKPIYRDDGKVLKSNLYKPVDYAVINRILNRSNQ